MALLGMEPDSHILDVRGDDGLFRQGTLVDCAPGGLMIDWECEGGPAPHFVPYGKIYLDRNPEFIQYWLEEAAAEGKEHGVEVLLRQSPREPKTWYPGTLLAGEFSSSTAFALVHAALPGGEKIVILPGQQIRGRATEDAMGPDGWMQVKMGRFVKDTVRLPENFSFDGSAEEIVNALNRINDDELYHARRTFVKAVKMGPKSLHYIRMGYNFLPKSLQEQSADTWETLLRHAASDCATIEKQKRKRKLSNAELKPTKAETEPELATSSYGIYILPTHILACTFEHLDSVDQARVRRVCAYWDSVLTSPCIKSVLRVHYKDKKQDYMSAASLHYGWTSHSKIIANGGVCAGSPLFCGGRLFRTLIQKGLHAPVQTIILANAVCAIRLHGRNRFGEFLGRFVKELNDLAAACQTLLLHNYNVKMDERCDVSVPNVTFNVLTGRIVGCLIVEKLWSRIEDGLPSLTVTQMKYVSDWIAIPDELNHEVIVAVLKDMQSSDPREGTHHRGRKWIVDDVATLDLQQLSNSYCTAYLPRPTGPTGQPSQFHFPGSTLWRVDRPGDWTVRRDPWSNSLVEFAVVLADSVDSISDWMFSTVRMNVSVACVHDLGDWLSSLDTTPYIVSSV